MGEKELPAAFRGSPMKRAKLRGLKRNAAVVLRSVGTAEDASALSGVLEDPDPLVRDHAACALRQLGRIEPRSERVAAKADVETG